MAQKRCPPASSEDYIAARSKLLDAEFALRNQIERVAELRRALPPGATMKEYVFKEVTAESKDGSHNGIRETTLADLTADGRSLAIYHLMFAPGDHAPCPMCSSFIDGLNGVGQHLSQRMAFAVIAKAPADHLATYAAKRGWNNIRFLSSHESDFNHDMNMETADKSQLPGLSVFKKDQETGNVRHIYTASANFEDGSERGLDLVNPLWNMMDLLPEGRDPTWYPADTYVKMARV